MSGSNSLVAEVLKVFNLINNTGLNEVKPAPNWEDFIQNSLIPCLINLEPQAEMFKAAGRPEPVVQGKWANKGMGKTQRNHPCRSALTSLGAPATAFFKVIQKVPKHSKPGVNHRCCIFKPKIYVDSSAQNNPQAKQNPSGSKRSLNVYLHQRSV